MILSKTLFTRLKIDVTSTWPSNTSFLHAKMTVSMLRVVNDTVERAIKLMQDFHDLITVEEEQKQYLLRCVQEHRKLYSDCPNISKH